MTIDYAKINEAMEKTRLEVRKIIMEEGAAAERARIVAWLLKEAEEHAPRDMGVVIRGLAREIERGEHAGGDGA